MEAKKKMELVTIDMVQQDNGVEELARRLGGQWVEIFDPYKAVERVFQHVETLPSSTTTRHTARQYRISLYDYLTFCGADITQDQTDKTRMEGDSFDFRGMGLHTEQQMRDYISYSQVQGRSSATIKKYLAVVGHYLDGLQKQAFIGV
ncbi:MAG: hypothetical protein AAFQ07_12055, partial [Chloroflexota bacterium]